MRLEPGPARRVAPVLKTLTALTALTTLMALLGCTAPRMASAEESDPALAAFTRAAANTPRGAPVDALQWERSLRPPDRFGPPVVRPGDAALLAAARAGRWDEALQLLKSGQGGANARDAAHGNALALAARAGQDALVREFIQRGAEIDRVGDDGFTALGAAAFEGRRSTVRLLALAGARLDRFSAAGQAPLHLASVAGQSGVIDELLRLKADPELLNRQRETALDVAAAAGQQDAMDRLLKAGADSLRAGRR